MSKNGDIVVAWMAQRWDERHQLEQDIERSFGGITANMSRDDFDEKSDIEN
jgi:hypothetical protein